MTPLLARSHEKLVLLVSVQLEAGGTVQRLAQPAILAKVLCQESSWRGMFSHSGDDKGASHTADLARATISLGGVVDLRGNLCDGRPGRIRLAPNHIPSCRRDA